MDANTHRQESGLTLVRSGYQLVIKFYHLA